jgi:soluble P-type ATPase
VISRIGGFSHLPDALPQEKKSMLRISVPSSPDLELEYLAIDYNGTLAFEGKLIDGVAERLVKLSEFLEIWVITADTYGLAREGLRDLPVKMTILPPVDTSSSKVFETTRLGKDRTVAVGNGYNDRLMLRDAALNIAVLGPEGLCCQCAQNADVVFSDINLALDALLNPKRLTATLRD